MGRIRLIVNADDFGFTRDVNEGIVEAHRKGILTAATLMANGSAFAHAVELARKNPSLDVGCHLVLIGGRSLAEPSRRLPASVPALVRSILARKLPVYPELKAQVLKTLATGIRPTHLDTHKHTHLLKPVLRAVASLAREFKIPWVRRPLDFSLSGVKAPWETRVTNFLMHRRRALFERLLAGCRTTDYFAGFQATGRLDARQLRNIIGQLRPGLTELMCHPGYLREGLGSARTRLKASREVELRALTDPAVRRDLNERGVELIGYGQA